MTDEEIKREVELLNEAKDALDEVERQTIRTTRMLVAFSVVFIVQMIAAWWAIDTWLRWLNLANGLMVGVVMVWSLTIGNLEIR